MAENNKLNSSLLLKEDDIPGAKLLKPIEQCSCAVLRRWLLCRVAKTSGKLAVCWFQPLPVLWHRIPGRDWGPGSYLAPLSGEIVVEF